MKTNNYFKLAILLLLFAFFGCQKENVVKLEGSKDHNSIEQVNNYIIKPEFISGDEIPDIIENLASKTNKTYSKISDLNGKLNYNKAKIFIKQAMKVAKEGEKTNYSFDIFLDDMPELEFYSLIVGKSEEGIIDEPYIIGYTMTKEDYENYIAHDLDFKYFRATQRFYTFDIFFADTAKGMTGRSGDCGEYVVGSGGTSSGGTSSNTGGGVTEPGETFISTFDGAIVTSDFGLSQNANQSNYDYVVTINTSNGSSETTTTGYSATVTTAATNSGGHTSIQTSGINWINFTITYNDTNSSGGSSGSSGPCIKTSGSGDDIIWYWYDECPPSTQLKRGDTGRSTTSFSDCFVVSGGIAVNVTLLAVEVNTMLGSIELNDDELAFLTKNHDATLRIFKFLRTNNSFEDRVFVKEAINDFMYGINITNLFEEFGNKNFLNNLVSSPSFQSTKTILEAATTASVDSKEILYAGTITNNAPIQYSFIGETPINGVEVVIQNAITTPISSLFHNHYNKASTGSPNDGRLFPTFSQADILNFFVLSNANLIQNSSNFNMILVTPDKSLHAIMIDDQVKFSNGLLLLQQGNFQDNLDIFESLLNNAFINNNNPINEGLSSTLAAENLNKILIGYGLAVYEFNKAKNRWVRP